jgi:hypothetical protein
LLLWVGFLVARASRLELYLPAPEELTDAVRMRVLDTSLAQEPMSLPDRGYLTPFLMASWSSSKASGVTNSS